MAEGFPNAPFAQGINVSWGGTEITVTAVSYSRSAEAEIDATSMYDSIVWIDNNNTENRRLVRDVQYGIVDYGEVQCEFIGPSTFDESKVGTKNNLTISGLDVAPSGIPAYLKSLSIQAKAGELVSGSCTFRLSGT